MKRLSIAVLVIILSLPVLANAAPLAGMPPVLDPNNIYAADSPNNLSEVVKGDPELVYVPNFRSATVSVIDPKTYKIIKTIKTHAGPQHIVPSWDLKTLWVNDNKGNYLTPIDPKTVTAQKDVYVHDPYNLYFTPNGKYAVVMAEADKQIVFRDPQTMAIKKTLKVPCDGVNHADWTADGNQFVATCEFTGKLILVDTPKMKLLKVATLPKKTEMNPMPQDIKISPDGKTYYIADMASNGIWVMPVNKFGHFTFIRTGKGAHAFRSAGDGRHVFVSNRVANTISRIDLQTFSVVATYPAPGGPDCMDLMADGKTILVTSRWARKLTVIDLASKKIVRQVPVGKSPHGVWTLDHAPRQ